VFSGCAVLKDMWDPREIKASFEKWLNFGFFFFFLELDSNPEENNDSLLFPSELLGIIF
jgi:hypothetical protein